MLPLLPLSQNTWNKKRSISEFCGFCSKCIQYLGTVLALCQVTWMAGSFNQSLDQEKALQQVQDVVLRHLGHKNLANLIVLKLYVIGTDAI